MIELNLGGISVLVQVASIAALQHHGELSDRSADIAEPTRMTQSRPRVGFKYC